MKANIRNREGLEEVEILKNPFNVEGIKLFVYHRDNFIITEWQTGMTFAKAEEEAKIKSAIKKVLIEVSIAKIKETIDKNIKKYGIANKESKEE